MEQTLQDDKEMVIEASEELEVVKSFDELGIREELLRGKNYLSVTNLLHLLIGYRNFRIWFQQAISCSIESHFTYNQG